MPEPITIFAVISICAHAYHLYKSEKHETTINSHHKALKRSHDRRRSRRRHQKPENTSKASNSSESTSDSEFNSTQSE
jgi:hypothetical protein